MKFGLVACMYYILWWMCQVDVGVPAVPGSSDAVGVWKRAGWLHFSCVDREPCPPSDRRRTTTTTLPNWYDHARLFFVKSWLVFSLLPSVRISFVGNDLKVNYTTWRLDDPALSAFTLWIAQLCCLRSHSLELSTSGRSRFLFIIVIIMFLQPSQNWTFLQGIWRWLTVAPSW